MNDQTQIEAGTALALPAGTDLTAMFAKPEQVDDVISRIEVEVRSHAPDPSTAKGRKAIASLAHTVARSKTTLDAAGKSLTDDARKQIAAVDAERRKVRERLDALKAEVRKPLDEWEAAEEERVERLKAALQSLTPAPVQLLDTETITAEIDRIKAISVDDSWAEYQEIADAKKEHALTDLTQWHDAAKVREDQAAELDRLRAEAEERARKDAEEAAAKAEAERQAKAKAEQERLAAEKVEADRIAAEEAEARRIEAEKAEADRREQAEREKAEAAERARKQAEEDAARREQEAAERHARELAEAKQREEAAAQRERDRIAEEQRQADLARTKREADRAHRVRIRNEIAEGLKTLDAGNWFVLADALIDDKVPHTRVTL
ncbi:hypothetical protein [Sulfitobacter dubius]|uniref:TolA protein n=1 Tax=Sulfitobacter dubius TaxID=218673 RepID=A0ABY3ZIK5_9RHOB|nr:hypothetical protein [Sulfitobacter dubius]UOA14485.1 hypothetical protein DSM109990_01291 [Sulfitobacter dubius]